MVSRRLLAAVGLVLVAAVAALVAVTAVSWVGWWGTRMPCHRNWGWLPSYLPRASPLRSIRFSIGEIDAKLCYGAPASRGRTMIGGAAVPFGALWRTGANEPTTITATGPVAVAGVPVSDGKASLYTIPAPGAWELIVNASTSQWGIETEYTDAVRARELGRAPVISGSTRSHVERLSFRAVPALGDTVHLVLEWERTRVIIPLWPLH